MMDLLLKITSLGAVAFAGCWVWTRGADRDEAEFYASTDAARAAKSQPATPGDSHAT